MVSCSKIYTITPCRKQSTLLSQLAPPTLNPCRPSRNCGTCATWPSTRGADASRSLGHPTWRQQSNLRSESKTSFDIKYFLNLFNQHYTVRNTQIYTTILTETLININDTSTWDMSQSPSHECARNWSGRWSATRYHLHWNMLKTMELWLKTSLNCKWY